MTVTLKKPTPACVPVHLTDRASLAQHAAALSPAERQWLATLGFTGAPDTHALLPDSEGGLQAVWAGVRAAGHPFALSALPRALPAGRYCLGSAGLQAEPEAAALLGGPRALRKFSGQLEEFCRVAPFVVQVQDVGGVKRYVREGSGS